MRLQPFGVISQSASFAEIIVHPVAFDIGFVIHVQSVFVAEFIETAVLRIVAETHTV